MNSLYDILNIEKIDIEKGIRVAIAETKKELNGLSVEQMCLVYTSYLYQNLKKEHIVCYIVDTKEDLGRRYQHRFIVLPKDDDNKYILDLTVSQFGDDIMFREMALHGYKLLNNDEYNLYVDYISVNYVKNKINR